MLNLAVEGCRFELSTSEASPVCSGSLSRRQDAYFMMQATAEVDI